MAETLRILYVDDEPDLLDLGKLFLEETREFSIITIDSASGALALLNTEQFDAIISDYQMPGMDGVQFLIEVRKKFGKLPFILFTGKGREEVVIQAINNGADFYLQKGGEPKSQFVELAHKLKKAVKEIRAEDAVRTSYERLTKSDADLNIHKCELETQAEELRRANLELGESRDKYLDLYEFAPVAYFTLNETAQIIDVNLTGALLLGSERGNLVMAQFSKFLQGKDADTWHRYFINLLHQDTKQACTLTLIRKDGSTFPARLESIRLSGVSDGATTVRVAISDISDIWTLAHSLKESEEKFRSLAESSPDYIMRYDRQCRHTYINPAALRAAGRTKGQIIGKTHWESGFDEPQGRTWEEKIDQVFETGKPFQAQFEWESVEGRMVLDWMLTPEFSEDGSVGSVLGVSRDITQLKKTEEELLRKNEELNASYKELAASQEELRSNIHEIFRQEQVLKESEERLQLKLASILEPDYDIGEVEFANIIDSREVQSLMDDFYSLTGMGIAILDLKGNILVATGWQDICTKFHRVNEQSCRNCLESDLYLTNNVKPGEYLVYKCKNNLWDMVTPIILGRKHVGNLFLGQFFFDDEIPDMTVFRAQAEKFGFNKEEYLAALDRVPRWSHTRVNTIMDFYTKFAALVSRLGYSNLKLAKALLDLQGTITALARSEEKFREYIEYSPEGIFVADAGGRYLEVNRAACDLVGYTREELLAMDISRLVPADALAASQKRFLDLQADGHFCVESRLQKKDGTKIPVMMNAVSLPNGSYLAFCSDITGRKKVEGSLKESEEALSAMLNGITESAFMMTPDGVILAMNETAANRLGQTCAEDMVGKNVFDFLPVDTAKTRKRKIQEVLVSGRPEQFEDVRNGRVIYQAIYPVRTPGGAVNRIAVFGVDITERKRAETELHESEERYNSLFTNNYSVSLLIDPETGLIMDANAAASRYYGYSSEQLRKMGICDINRIEKEIVIRNLKAARDRKKRHFYSSHFLSDGSRRDVEIYSGPIPVSGKLLFYSIIHDITDRKMAEEALQESELLFREVVNNANDAVFLLERTPDGPGRYLLVNDKAVQMLGYSKDELSRMSPRDIVPEEVQKKIMPDILKKLRKDGHATFESAHRRKDGSTYPVEVSTHAFHYKGKDVDLSIIRDITMRKQVEKTLRESEERYRSILQTSMDGFWMIDVQSGRFTDANETYSRMTGYTRAELLTLHIPDIDAMLDLEEQAACIKSMIMNGSGIFETRHRRKDGSIFDVEISVTYQNTDGGRLFCFCRDITERKRAEGALHKANRKLNLLSGITRHDINNQLLTLNGFLKLLRKQAPDPSLEEYFTRITKVSSRISAMIQFTREYEQIGLSAPLWQEVCKLVETAAKETTLGQIVVNNELSAGMQVFADPLIGRVFYNLMDNAVRYGGKITTIGFSVEEHDGNHVIVCEDDGNGVPAEEKEKIFERGFGKNTGLGLALAREILDITGITVRETGGPGKGARFEMVVPEGMWRKMAENST